MNNEQDKLVQQRRSEVGPGIGVAIVVVLIILGGIYFFVQQYGDQNELGKSAEDLDEISESIEEEFGDLEEELDDIEDELDALEQES